VIGIYYEISELYEIDNKLKELLTSVMNQFKTNENNCLAQKLHMDNMFMNLNRLIVDSLYNLNLENKFNFDKLKQESIRLENRLNSIENQLKQLHFGEIT
jgi:site-specific DNA-adenine methylase